MKASFYTYLWLYKNEVIKNSKCNITLVPDYLPEMKISFEYQIWKGLFQLNWIHFLFVALYHLFIKKGDSV